MSESDIDAMIERMAREEQEDLDRAQGQFILDVLSAERRQEQGREFLEMLHRAHQAEVEKAEQE